MTNHVALLTPPTPGAIATIQLVGPDALQLATRIFKPNSDDWPESDPYDRAVLGYVFHDDQRIDQAVVTASLLPNSRQVVEFHVHGGVRIAQHVILALTEQGATLNTDATRQAVEVVAAGRTAIERDVLAALAMAKTRRAAVWLAMQRRVLPGALSDICQSLRQRSDPAENIVNRLVTIADRHQQARLLIDGIRIAVVGPPNAGKSTLVNRLTERQVSLVAEQPGTTRDWVAESAAIDGVPVTVVDSAGLGPARDELDSLAQAQAQAQATQADLRLLVVDGSEPVGKNEVDLAGELTRKGPALAVLTKADLPQTIAADAAAQTLGLPAVSVCALTGAGIDQLGRQILHAVEMTGFDQAEPAALTANQVRLLRDAAAAVHADQNQERARSILDKMLVRADR